MKLMLSEIFTPSLIKGPLLSDLGGRSFVYDGTFKGLPVVIKEARDEKHIPFIQKELRSLEDFGELAVEAMFTDYGIPLQDWKVRTSFIKPILEAISKEMISKGEIVLEKAGGEVLTDEFGDRLNYKVPFKFHFGAIMSWLDMLVKLKSNDLAMDSNIDTDLFLMPDIEKKVLEVVRVDCEIGKATDFTSEKCPSTRFWLKHHFGSVRTLNLNLEQASVSQVIDQLELLFLQDMATKSLFSNSILEIRGRFNEGMISDARDLLSLLKRNLGKIDWDHFLLRSDDSVKIKRWVGGSF